MAAAYFSWAGGGLENCGGGGFFPCPRRAPPQTRAISTEPQSHRRQEWALITVQRSEGPSGQFSISANGTPGESINFADSFSCPPGEGYVLELGGFSAEPAELFYAHVAEIIIFRGGLGAGGRPAITHYPA